MSATFASGVMVAGPKEHGAEVPELRGISPQGLACDPQSAPFIASANGHIQHLVDRDVAVILANTGGRPAGLAFDAAGNLYVADGGRKAVLKITASGKTTVVSDRFGEEAFVEPARLTMALDGQLYFTDTASSRVYRIDTQGRTLLVTSELHGPTGIAVSADGSHLLVGDKTGTIWKLGVDGKHLSHFANLHGRGEPAGMALDEKGNLYVACGGAVAVLSPQGKQIDSYKMPGRRVTDVAFGGPDLKDLYIADAGAGAVYKARAKYRVQRLPWEPDDPLRLTEPVDGAVLNRHDGEVTANGLRITVRGLSRATGPVRINGAIVAVQNGQFQTELLLQGRETRIRAEAAGGVGQEITVLYDRDSFPRYRVSTDDNILFLKDIALHAGAYQSIFDNAYLAFWREMHRKYGAKVHFNLYYETAGFNLSQMPDKFRPEWQKNADWIHLSFHARANDPDRPYLHASAEQIRADYRLVMREIARFAGPELLTPFTTVHWGSATLEAVRALRAEGVLGLVGYFQAYGDAPLVSYYLPRAQWQNLSAHDYWKDTKEDILFVRHDIVINMFSLDEIVPHLEKVAADPHQSEVMELMIHEQYFYPSYIHYEPDYRQRVECAIEWVTKRGYKPVFYGDGFLGAPPGAANGH